MKVCIVGTHGIGKTTLAYLLASYAKRNGENAEVINEIVRRCPFPLNDGFSIEGATWTICEQVRRELDSITQGCGMTICDRSALDPIFYLKARGFDEELFIDLERFATNWLSTYDHIIWLLPSGNTPLLADGVRSLVPDFQRVIHEFFYDFFEKNPHIQYTSITSEEVFRDELRKVTELLNTKVLVEQ